MKNRLSQLTMQEYIELICGNDSILLERDDEKVEPQQMAINKRNIIYEYKQISDPAGLLSYISDEDNKKKTSMEVLLFRLCDNLIRAKAFDEVREILTDYGLRANGFDEEKLKQTVLSRLNRALSMQKKDNLQVEDDKQTPQEIRAIFDKQAAYVMTYFKFQINMNEIGAAVFANILYQYSREIKEKMALIKK